MGSIRQKVTPAPAETPPKPRKRHSPLWALLLLVALAVTMAGIFPFRQIIGQQRAVELTVQKHEALASENDRLQEEVDLLQSDAEIERIAREDFGLVREGEVGYVVEWIETEPAPPPDPALPPPDPRAWYEKLWDWASGRQFEPDD